MNNKDFIDLVFGVLLVILSARLFLGLLRPKVVNSTQLTKFSKFPFFTFPLTNKNAPFYKIVYLTVSTLILISGLYIVLSTDVINSLPKLVPSQTKELTVWKSYADSKQMYAIKYPPEWYVFPNILGGVVRGYNGTVISSARELEPHGEILAEEGQAGISINIVGIDKTESQSLADYLSRRYSSPDESVLTYSSVEINGNQGLKYVQSVNDRDPGQSTYYISDKNLVYAISTSIKNSQYENTVSQILQTFEFAQ